MDRVQLLVRKVAQNLGNTDLRIARCIIYDEFPVLSQRQAKQAPVVG